MILSYRGNSKYHYYGIRIKADSALNQLVPDDTPVAMRQAAQAHTRPAQARHIKPNSTGDGGEGGVGSVKSDSSSNAGGESTQHKQFLGTPHDAIPQVDLTVCSESLPEGITQDDVNTFDTVYKEHCEVRAFSSLSLIVMYCKHTLIFNLFTARNLPITHPTLSDSLVYLLTLTLCRTMLTCWL